MRREGRSATANERQVIAERARGRTLADIGNDLQISAERVRQILRRAQNKALP